MATVITDSEKSFLSNKNDDHLKKALAKVPDNNYLTERREDSTDLSFYGATPTMRGSQGLNTSQRLNSGRRQSKKLDTPCSSESLIELERLRTENAKLTFMLKEARDQNRHQDELAKAEIALLESMLHERANPIPIPRPRREREGKASTLRHTELKHLWPHSHAGS